MNNIDLSTPQRQVALGSVVFFFINLRKSLQAIIVLFLPLLGKRGPMVIVVFSILIFSLLVFIAIISYVQWKRFLFYVEKDDFVIRKGVLRKQKVHIPLERIQSIHIHESVIHRIFGLAALKLDTAGSADQEGEISALPKEYAIELKAQLLSMKANQTEPVQGEEVNKEIESNDILQLSPLHLLKVGITENHLRSLLIIVSAYFFIVNQYSSIAGYEEENILKETLNQLYFWFPVFLITIFIASILVSLVLILIRYYNLTVRLTHNGLEVSHGLLKKEENIVPRNKLQFITWASNPLQRWIGYQSLALYQASSTKQDKKKAVRIVGCDENHRSALNSALFPDKLDEEEHQIKPHPFWLTRVRIFLAIPLLVIGAVLAWQAPLYTVSILIPAILFYFWTGSYYQSIRASLSDQFLTIERGYIFRSFTKMEVHKVQNITIKQSLFQKRRNVYNVVVHTAAGSKTIPYLPSNDALLLTNKLLYLVEHQNLAWM